MLLILLTVKQIALPLNVQNGPHRQEEGCVYLWNYSIQLRWNQKCIMLNWSPLKSKPGHERTQRMRSACCAGIKTVRQLCEWLFCISCLFLSFYERKYKVFLRLFAHQREYQALMNQRWRCLWEAAVLVPTLSGVIVMTNPRTGNKNRSPNLAAFTYIITGPVFFYIHFLNSSVSEGWISVRGHDCCHNFDSAHAGFQTAWQKTAENTSM